MPGFPHPDGGTVGGGPGPDGGGCGCLLVALATVVSMGLMVIAFTDKRFTLLTLLAGVWLVRVVGRWTGQRGGFWGY
jgi:hypothetical protein